jgi:imidazolonepropionase-like amidohydrolase
MIRNIFVLAALLAGAATPPAPAVLYEGARLIPGDGSRPIESGAILVENGTITKIGSQGSVTAPRGTARVDLRGKTIMPTLINAHGHPGFQRGLTYSAENFTFARIRSRENLVVRGFASLEGV